MCGLVSEEKTRATDQLIVIPLKVLGQGNTSRCVGKANDPGRVAVYLGASLEPYHMERTPTHLLSLLRMGSLLRHCWA